MGDGWPSDEIVITDCTPRTSHFVRGAKVRNRLPNKLKLSRFASDVAVHGVLAATIPMNMAQVPRCPFISVGTSGNDENCGVGTELGSSPC